MVAVKYIQAWWSVILSVIFVEASMFPGLVYASHKLDTDLASSYAQIGHYNPVRVPANNQTSSSNNQEPQRTAISGILELLFSDELQDPEPQSGTFTIVPINSQNGNPRGYLEYLPPNYDSRNDWPVLVHFHGVGLVGSGTANDLEVLKTTGIGEYLSTEDRNFIVLIPQDHNGFWGNRAYTFIEWALTEYQPKDNRNNWHAIYMSGAGGGFNRYCEDNPASLAIVASHTPASALTTSGDNASYQNCAESGASFWFHHEDDDAVVGSGQTKNYYRGILEEVGAENLDKYRYTLYDRAGHNADDLAFRDTGINIPQVTGNITITPFTMQWFNWSTGSWWDWLLLQER